MINLSILLLIPKNKQKKNRNGKHKASGVLVSGATEGSTLVSELTAVGSLAKRAFAAFKYGAKLLNSEIKHVDVSDVAVAVGLPATGAYSLLLCGVAQGDTHLTRDGNSLKISRLYGNVTWAMDSAATLTRVRTFLVADTQCQGSNSLVVSSDASNFMNSNGSCNGLYNVDTYPGRFYVLMDRFDILRQSATTQQVHFTFDIKEAQNAHLRFSGTGATVASLQGLVFYLVAVSTQGSSQPVITVDARMEFIDN